ncbi:MAG TPA: GNAT family N-acetyltransferase [Prolixibacteraceae bacterium]|nr:GNAT family N-acetyltransferase [Prolixibacteraceae bacterium]HPS12962.1 GNAT family N-acetyltransferase [Prolixibacteraceae bacterium]
MELEIKIEQEGNNGNFHIELEGRVIAQMTFFIEDKEQMVIDHTEVNPEFNGKGYGKRLVAKAVEFARETGLKIVPVCPFVKTVLSGKPDYRDVLCD